MTISRHFHKINPFSRHHTSDHNQAKAKKDTIESNVLEGQPHPTKHALDFLPHLATLSKLDPKEISHAQARQLLEAGGADNITEAHVGNCLDKALNVFFSQLATLPIKASQQALAMGGVALPDTAHATIKTGRDAASMYTRYTTKTALTNFGFFGRSTKRPEDYEGIVPPELLHRYTKNMEDLLDVLKSPSNTKPQDGLSTFKEQNLEDLKRSLHQQIEASIKANKDFKLRMLLTEQQMVQIVASLATTGVDIVASGLGAAALARMDLGLCAYLISLVTRPLTDGMLKAVSNWYETKTIANLVLHKYKKMCTDADGTTRQISDDDVQKLSHYIQDHFQSKNLANFHRRNENVFQLELMDLEQDIESIGYKILKTQEQAQADSDLEQDLIDQKFKKIQEINHINAKLSTKYLKEDMEDTSLLLDYAEYVKNGMISTTQFKHLVDKKSAALFSVMTSPDPQAMELSEHIKKVYTEQGNTDCLIDHMTRRVKENIEKEKKNLAQTNAEVKRTLIQDDFVAELFLLSPRDQYLDDLLLKTEKRSILLAQKKDIENKLVDLKQGHHPGTKRINPSKNKMHYTEKCKELQEILKEKTNTYAQPEFKYEVQFSESPYGISHEET